MNAKKLIDVLKANKSHWGVFKFVRFEDDYQFNFPLYDHMEMVSASNVLPTSAGFVKIDLAKPMTILVSSEISNTLKLGPTKEDQENIRLLLMKFL